MSDKAENISDNAMAGASLARAREALGLSTADVAKQLRLSTWQIEALEADDYRKLPGPTFVRGFIRNYAKLLQIDATPLLASSSEIFDRLPAPKTASAVYAIPFPSKQDKGWRKYAFVGVLIGLIVPFLIFQTKEDTRTPSKPSATSSHDLATIETPSPDQASEIMLPVNPADGATDSGSVIKRSIKLTFLQESWTEIRDTYGNTIFSQLNPAGSEQLVEGDPPFSLVVGNASMVKIAYNDQQVDLAPYTKAEIARLTLP